MVCVVSMGLEEVSRMLKGNIMQNSSGMLGNALFLENACNKLDKISDKEY